MIWQQNLAGNILAATIIVGLIVIIYCRVTNKTLVDVIREIREGFSTPEYE